MAPPWLPSRLRLLPRLRRLRRSRYALFLAALLLLGVAFALRGLSQRLTGAEQPLTPGFRLRLLTGGFASLMPAEGPRLRGTLYLGVVLDRDQVLNADTVMDLRGRVEELDKAFRTVYPEVTIQLQVFRSDTIIPELAARVRSGLAPDLLVVSGLFANDLQLLGLTEPTRLGPEERRQFNEAALDRLRLPDGRMTGVPLLFHPEVACFNRSRLDTSPATVEELLQRSAEGTRVGLAAHPLSLYWTAGSLGANGALVEAARGRSLTPEQRQRLRDWLVWLRAASLQHRVTVYADQNQMLKDFHQGRLDWISCSSIDIPTLRQQLGPRLGVAPLPSGPGGDPTPVSRERVMVFGRGSSPEQRRIAEAMVRFSINPLIQRNFTLGTMAVLPVNRFVPPPVNSSATLAALAESQRQSDANPMLVEFVHPGDPRLGALARTLVQLLFGDLDPDAATAVLIEELRPAPHQPPAPRR
ncbi:MAG: extracellular solute-binding protein [Synechococcus sp.]